MDQQMNPFHHALRIRKEICIGCSRCMRVCPTEALRVIDGKATLHPEWCIDCGECFNVCPVRAIVVEDDDIAKIFRYKHRILLIPSVFFAQFEEKLTLDAIKGILYDMGFTELCTVEQGADLLVDEINRYVAEFNGEKPVISSYCPAVVRLIQVRFPSFADRVMRLIPPLEITAQYYRSEYEKNGVPLEDVGIFYVTPCAAKIAAIKAPVGGYVSPINGVINMSELYNKVFLAYKQKGTSENEHCTLIHSSLSSVGVRWPTTGGEAAIIQDRALAIDSMPNVIEFLERLENEEIKGVDFLELRACDMSCCGGILVQGNRFLIKERIDKMAEELPKKHMLDQKFRNVCSGYIPMDPVEPRAMIKYHADFTIALQRMEEARRLLRRLPDIDCGACGAPSCEALADDIVCNRATMEHCVILHAHQADPEMMEKIWGKKRFIKK
ncbi:MAG: [Fe-Fe] hydrogenase large subunit C-terminal domain-containing protein [Bacteroidales bacterium]|jgi:Na+-translocating ferredoxin:NAD+ oxidoreductase RNF subunit RnfB|nr:[Fe-Fe] hydrogenase large subunit C-terminal domain-containing protein [Bacteroidales bacterium]MDD3208679.1 [Fe-Fe] hydrogenase large subunit C-terminal domain-containing protein [Bacteroidales bacterium]MDD3697242.1 [Fe-Fe] hydrogenase large subunit C-terminal domain-containing protein [Bacteroidales bacterium]MDD4167766.1 [Fe-Fe] hydrogenase large subunit C-terminal domain-containing protein [Bacteroidales bacterium]MDD4472950.1 [Fe-Fe] hydrogenase large subunit C-terminal domain-containi